MSVMKWTDIGEAGMSFVKYNFLNQLQLFNGDFVDRGSFSVECIFTLFGFKLLYPEHFFMSRGNILVI